MLTEGPRKPRHDIRNLAVTMMAAAVLRPFAKNPRDHGKAHIDDIVRSIVALV